MRQLRLAHFFIREVKNMDNYKNIYYKMFNKVTDIIEELKKIQQEMEEKYIESVETDVSED